MRLPLFVVRFWLASPAGLLAVSRPPPRHDLHTYFYATTHTNGLHTFLNDLISKHRT